MGHATRNKSARVRGYEKMGNTMQETRKKILSSDRATSENGNDETRCTEPSLGRDDHGYPDWVDYAILYESCDSRADELRMLGNGVVPATAERAFRVRRKNMIML